MPETPSARAKTGRSRSRKQGEPGKSADTPKLSRGAKTICIPFEVTSYPEVVRDNERFRSCVDDAYARHPELFPVGMGEGYRLHDMHVSAKLDVRVRHIKLAATGEVCGVHPSFVMPYMVGYTADVEHALFPEDFGVPSRALTHVFGRDDMYWYRLTAAVGRNSIVGTTVKRPESLPADLPTDEKHTKHCGDKVYAAVTSARDCVSGAAMSRGTDAAALSQGYGVFAREARNLDPDYRAETVNADGRGATRKAWQILFPQIVVIQCFLHAFVKIRDRCKKWGELFAQIATAVWDACEAPNKRAFSQRIRRLREWAQKTLEAFVQALGVEQHPHQGGEPRPPAPHAPSV